MSRTNRGEVFAADEIAVVHVMNRVVRRCFLMGDDPVSGKNFDHRKRWIEDEIQRSAANFGIDLIAFCLLSNHMHLILRSRPDVVVTWDDTEVARRWLMLCPKRKDELGRAKEPTMPELNSIRHDADKTAEIRGRLSDISWWMRLLCQRIAQQTDCRPASSRRPIPQSPASQPLPSSRNHSRAADCLTLWPANCHFATARKLAVF